MLVAYSMVTASTAQPQANPPGWVDVINSALPDEPTELPGRQVLPSRGARADAAPRRRTTPPIVHRDTPPLTVVAR